MPTKRSSQSSPKAITYLLPTVLSLAGCTESTPVSPPDRATEAISMTSASLRRIDIEIGKTGRLERLTDGQQFVVLTVRGRCPVGYVLTEEPLTLTQGELGFGQAGFPMPCTGRWERRSFRVFSVGEVEFQRGPARANVALVVEHTTTGELLRATDTETVRLR